MIEEQGLCNTLTNQPMHELTKNRENEFVVKALAHNLRSPLTSILSLTHLLESELKDVLNEQTKYYFNLIKNSCMDSTSMLEDMLDISLLESDKFHLTKTEVELNALLAHVTNRFTETLRVNDISIHVQLPTHSLNVDLDECKMKQAIDNLLSNACKFTKPGGSITVSAETTETTISILITDTGIGIPDELKESLFEKFTSSKRKGLHGEKTTGLGLAITKQIIESHNGTIEHEDNVPKGSKFTIRLPR